MKKAKGKVKSAARKSAAKKSEDSTKKRPDVVKVRENINDLVTESAKDIAEEVIKVAKTGQLASARYLFEAVGLYPATEETKAQPQRDSLAYTLLRHMGLPTEPVIVDEDLPPAVAAGRARPAGHAAEPDVEGDEQEALPEEIDE